MIPRSYIFVLFICSQLIYGCSSNKESQLSKEPSKLITNSLPKIVQKGIVEIDSVEYGLDQVFISGTYEAQETPKQLAIVLTSLSSGTNTVTAHTKNEDGEIKFQAYVPMEFVPKYFAQLGIAVKADDAQEFTCQLTKVTIFNAETKKFAFSTKNNIIEGFVDNRKETAGSWSFEGWAVAKGAPEAGNKIYLALTAEQDTQLFETILLKRPDIANHLPKEPSAIQAGFKTVVQKNKILGGVLYQVGIVVQNATGTFYKDMNQAIQSLDGKLLYSKIIPFKELGALVEDDGSNTQGHIDNVKITEKCIFIEGWATAKKPLTSTSTYILFRSPVDTIVFVASLAKRGDIADYLKSQVFLKSGFVSVIPKTEFKHNSYKVNAIVKNGDTVYITTVSTDVVLK